MARALRISPLLVCLAAVFGLASVSGVNAGHDNPPTWHDPVPFYGYAWSEAVGWISFSCTNDSSCASDGGVDYGVFIDVSGSGPYDEHNINGFAWNSNVGWIQFGDGGIGNDLPYFAGYAAYIVTTSPLGIYDPDAVGSVKGWVRACAASQNADCQDPVHPESGDWDGWILLNCSLSGITCPAWPVYFVTNTDNNGGFTNQSRAWGGGTTIGWIDFNVAAGTEVTYVPPCPDPDTLLACNGDNTGYVQYNEWCHSEEILCDAGAGESCVDTPSVACVAYAGIGDYTLEVNKTFVRSGDTVSITWGLDVPSQATSCTLRGTNGDVFTSDGTVQTDVSSAITLSSTIFTLECIPLVSGDPLPVNDIASASQLIDYSSGLEAGGPIEALFDDDTNSQTYGGVTSMYFELDLGEPYDLSRTALFGDANPGWTTGTWSLETKQQSSDSYVAQFTDRSAQGANQWYTENLAVTARYVRVTINGVDFGGVDVREFHLEAGGTVSQELGNVEVTLVPNVIES